MTGLLAAGCLEAPTEGSGRRAQEGTFVEVMLLPFDRGATLAEGAGAFDAEVPTTDSLAELADGRGVFVIGVADGLGIALVPRGFADEVASADPEQDAEVPSGDVSSPEEPASCASDCGTWCVSSLAACDGLDVQGCDCWVDDAPACASDCRSWCDSSLVACDGLDVELCDCTVEPADEDPQTCTWDCAEWCTSSLDYCGEDGEADCADSCGSFEAQPVPASAFAAEWTAPTVVDGVTLVVGLTDPRARDALGRGQPIGSQVGGTYGRQADQVLLRLLDAVVRSGVGTDDPTLSCGQRLLNRGYPVTASTSASETIRVGICQKDGAIEVWPVSIGIIPGFKSSARFVFEQLVPGTGTPSSDVWVQLGQAAAQPVAPGRSVPLDARLDQGPAIPLEVRAPRSGATTRVPVAVQR